MWKIRRESVARDVFMASLALAMGVAAAGYAQSKYPKSVVTLATHSSPGGGSDVFLREMAPHLSKIMRVTFVVENLQGGSGAKAMATIARAKPDGGMFYATPPTFIYTSLLSKPAASYRDLEPLVNIFYDPEVLYTAVDSPFKTLRDVIDRARKGGGDMLINVLNHTLDMGIGELQELAAQLEARKVRLLAVVGDQRLSRFPELKTAREQGIDLSVRKFRGLAGHQGYAARSHHGLGGGDSKAARRSRL